MPVHTSPQQSESSNWRNLRWAFAILLLPVLFSLFVHLRGDILPYDDAFITFRYAKNLLDGNGPVFNIGERVYGYTSPVYLMWISALGALFRGVPLPTLATYGNAAWFVAAGLMVFLYVWRVTARPLLAASVGSAVLVQPALLQISHGAIESSMLTAFLFATLTAAVQRSAGTAGLLAGIATLTRPEAVVLLPLAIARFWGDRTAVMRVVWSFGLSVGMWALFAWWYYGTPVPLPVIAKATPLYPIAPLTALHDLANALVTAMTPLRDLDGAAMWVATLVVLFPLLFAIGRPVSRHRGGWMAPAALLAVLGLYAAGNPLVFQWYWAPLLCTAIVSAALGWAACFSFRAPAAAIVVVASLAVQLVFAYTDPATGFNEPFFSRDDAELQRIVAYRAVAERLNVVARRSDVVAAPEVGALGFYFEGTIRDACGLVSPQALKYLPVPPDQRLGPDVGAISVDFVRGTSPQWVVTLPLFAGNSLLQSDWFRSEYQLWGRAPLPKPLWGGQDVLVFHRRSVL
jgi:hypothetical protein